VPHRGAEKNLGVNQQGRRDRHAAERGIIDRCSLRGLPGGGCDERERKRVQPIVDTINDEYARLQTISEEELRGQTEKFRARIREATSGLEARIAELRAEKHATADSTERERIDTELSGLDGRGGVEAELRDATAKVLDEILPEAFATVREAARRLLGTTVGVTGHDLEWNMVPYDVQLMGGIELHLGKIAEMATGEGKTLVATLPLYLNSLPGKGAHLITVNSYLARRDSEWMGHVYKYLGLTVGCLDDTEPGSLERRAAYECDITYGTNNEFGFDYLRDNMVVANEQRVQRGHVYAIVDEVDSVLIDEARTPLIISGPVGNESDAEYGLHNAGVARLVKRQSDLSNMLVADGERALEAGDTDLAAVKFYQAQMGAPKNKRLLKVLQETGVKQLVLKMELEHLADRKLPAGKQQYRDVEEGLLYVLDEKGHTVHLTDQGVDYMSPNDHDAFVLPDISQEVHRIDHDPDMTPEEKLATRNAINVEYAAKSEKLNIVHQLLRAHALYENDVNYVVQDGQVLIVDEFTGRTMPGRRWSEGLHQAVEAKEGVQVKGETQTLATITIQNYFRMYTKLAGMTGTAETEETEFHEIYGLDVSVIPTNRPVIRDDRQDLVYKTRREKYNAMLEETERLHKLGYPVLVGTVSVDVSETLSRMFKRAGIVHNVLNAKYHQREAEIVAGAGQPAGHQEPVKERERLVGEPDSEERRRSDARVPGPGVTVVPVADPADLLGQGRRGGRHGGSRRGVGEEPESDQASYHGGGSRALVGDLGGPVTPPSISVLERTERLVRIHEDERLSVGDGEGQRQGAPRLEGDLHFMAGHDVHVRVGAKGQRAPAVAAHDSPLPPGRFEHPALQPGPGVESDADERRAFEALDSTDEQALRKQTSLYVEDHPLGEPCRFGVWADGEAMSLDQALAYAVEASTPAPFQG